MSGDTGWTPVLSADQLIYCAKRCGAGCTKDAFDQATAEAQALATRMGDGWEPRVWENGGWNYQVRKGDAEIHVERSHTGRREGWSVTGYSAWINLHDTACSNSTVQFIVHAKEPEDALGVATQQANGMIARIRSALDEIAQ